MIYLEFNTNILVIIIFTIIVVVCIIGLILYSYFSLKSNKLYRRIIRHGFNNSRTFIIDMNNQTVKWFDSKKVKNVYHITYVDFLNFFISGEQNNVRNWITSIFVLDLTKEEQEKVLITTEIVSKVISRNGISKAAFFISAIDKEKKLLYLDSILLPHIPVQLKSKKHSKEKQKHDFRYSLGEIKKIFDEDGFANGSFLIVRLFPKVDSTLIIDEYYLRCLILEYIFREHLEGELYINIEDDKPLDIVILNKHLTTSHQFDLLLNKLYLRISEILEISSASNGYNLVIGGAKVFDLDTRNYEKAHDSLDRLIKNGYDEMKKIIIYHPDSSEVKSLEDSYKTEINKILRNQLVEVYYEPVVCVYKNKVVVKGYGFNLKVKETYFKDYNELKARADQCNLDKEIFSLSSKKIISTFTSQKDDQKCQLIYPLELSEIPFVNRSFPHFARLNEANITFLFENNEFIDYENDDINEKVINNLKQKGYECALRIKFDDYSLKDSSYKMFDSYFFDFNDLPAVKQNSREFLKIHSMLERFVKFYKPIICFNVQDFATIELLMKSGISYFTSKAISAESSMLLPLEKRIIKKLLSLNKN